MAKIIIIEDEADIAKVTAFRLKKAGYEVMTVADGAKGLEMIKTALPDMVLLDINLPGYLGTQICSIIKNDEKLKDITVLMFTASADDIENKTKEAGADDYLVKPYEPQVLLSKIELLLFKKKVNERKKKQDESIKEILPDFVAHRKHDLINLQKALHDNDFDTIKSIGHSLRGAGGTFGFNKISEIGEALEYCAKEKKHMESKEKIEELSEIVENIKL